MAEVYDISDLDREVTNGELAPSYDIPYESLWPLPFGVIVGHSAFHSVANDSPQPTFDRRFKLIGTGNPNSPPFHPNPPQPPLPIGSAPVVQPHQDFSVALEHGNFWGNLIVCAHADCTKGFPSRAKLHEHAKKENHQAFECLCGVHFTRFDALDRHVKGHDKTKKFECQLCNKYDGDSAFGRRDHLLQHLRVAHKLDQKGLRHFAVRGETGSHA